MGIPAAMSHALETWSAFYGDHKLVAVTIRFLHLAAILVAGGTALAADRAVLRAWRGGEEEHASALALLRGSHSVVVPSLAVVVVTGALLTAADTDTFLNSRVYWVKLGLVGLLLANGAGMLAAEAAVRRGTPWLALLGTAIASLGLWLALLYAGTLLTVAA